MFEQLDSLRQQMLAWYESVPASMTDATQIGFALAAFLLGGLIALIGARLGFVLASAVLVMLWGGDAVDATFDPYAGWIWPVVGLLAGIALIEAVLKLFLGQDTGSQVLVGMLTAAALVTLLMPLRPFKWLLRLKA